MRDRRDNLGRERPEERAWAGVGTSKATCLFFRQSPLANARRAPQHADREARAQHRRDRKRAERLREFDRYRPPAETCGRCCRVSRKKLHQKEIAMSFRSKVGVKVKAVPVPRSIVRAQVAGELIHACGGSATEVE